MSTPAVFLPHPHPSFVPGLDIPMVKVIQISWGINQLQLLLRQLDSNLQSITKRDPQSLAKLDYDHLHGKYENLLSILSDHIAKRPENLKSEYRSASLGYKIIIATRLINQIVLCALNLSKIKTNRAKCQELYSSFAFPRALLPWRFQGVTEAFRQRLKDKRLYESVESVEPGVAPDKIVTLFNEEVFDLLSQSEKLLIGTLPFYCWLTTVVSDREYLVKIYSKLLNCDEDVRCNITIGNGTQRDIFREVVPSFKTATEFNPYTDRAYSSLDTVGACTTDEQEEKYLCIFKQFTIFPEQPRFDFTLADRPPLHTTSLRFHLNLDTLECIVDEGFINSWFEGKIDVFHLHANLELYSQFKQTPFDPQYKKAKSYLLYIIKSLITANSLDYLPQQLILDNVRKLMTNMELVMESISKNKLSAYDVPVSFILRKSDDGEVVESIPLRQLVFDFLLEQQKKAAEVQEKLEIKIQAEQEAQVLLEKKKAEEEARLEAQILLEKKHVEEEARLEVERQAKQEAERIEAERAERKRAARQRKAERRAERKAEARALEQQEAETARLAKEAEVARLAQETEKVRLAKEAKEAEEAARLAQESEIARLEQEAKDARDAKAEELRKQRVLLENQEKKARAEVELEQEVYRANMVVDSIIADPKGYEKRLHALVNLVIASLDAYKVAAIPPHSDKGSARGVAHAFAAKKKVAGKKAQKILEPKTLLSHKDIKDDKFILFMLFSMQLPKSIQLLVLNKALEPTRLEQLENPLLILTSHIRKLLATYCEVAVIPSHQRVALDESMNLLADLCGLFNGNLYKQPITAAKTKAQRKSKRAAAAAPIVEVNEGDLIVYAQILALYTCVNEFYSERSLLCPKIQQVTQTTLELVCSDLFYNTCALFCTPARMLPKAFLQVVLISASAISLYRKENVRRLAVDSVKTEEALSKLVEFVKIHGNRVSFDSRVLYFYLAMLREPQQIILKRKKLSDTPVVPSILGIEDIVVAKLTSQKASIHLLNRCYLEPKILFRILDVYLKYADLQNPTISVSQITLDSSAINNIYMHLMYLFCAFALSDLNIDADFIDANRDKILSLTRFSNGHADPFFEIYQMFIATALQDEQELEQYMSLIVTFVTGQLLYECREKAVNNIRNKPVNMFSRQVLLFMLFEEVLNNELIKPSVKKDFARLTLQHFQRSIKPRMEQAIKHWHKSPRDIADLKDSLSKLKPTSTLFEYFDQVTVFIVIALFSDEEVASGDDIREYEEMIAFCKLLTTKFEFESSASAPAAVVDTSATSGSVFPTHVSQILQGLSNISGIPQPHVIRVNGHNSNPEDLAEKIVEVIGRKKASTSSTISI